MTIIELLERNAREWPNDTALVEINPDQPETRRVTWHDFELVEPSVKQKHYRREITWAVFDEKANRVANMLLYTKTISFSRKSQFPCPLSYFCSKLSMSVLERCTRNCFIVTTHDGRFMIVLMKLPVMFKKIMSVPIVM